MSPYNLFGLIFMSFPSALQDNFTAIWDADVIARTVLPYVAESAITTVSICTPLRPHLSILLSNFYPIYRYYFHHSPIDIFTLDPHLRP